ANPAITGRAVQISAKRAGQAPPRHPGGRADHPVMRPADCCRQHSAEHPKAAVRAPGPGSGSAGRRMGKSLGVRFSGYSFGSVRVDGVAYDHDLISDRGKIRKRKKGASRKFRGAYGHTPLSAAEDIPWRCRRLVVGTGADGALPVMKEVHEQARRREVDLVILPTAPPISLLPKTTKPPNPPLPLPY